jgi:hypothetical protein
MDFVLSLPCASWAFVLVARKASPLVCPIVILVGHPALLEYHYGMGVPIIGITTMVHPPDATRCRYDGHNRNPGCLPLAPLLPDPQSHCGPDAAWGAVSLSLRVVGMGELHGVFKPRDRSGNSNDAITKMLRTEDYQSSCVWRDRQALEKKASQWLWR